MHLHGRRRKMSVLCPLPQRVHERKKACSGCTSHTIQLPIAYETRKPQSVLGASVSSQLVTGRQPLMPIAALLRPRPKPERKRPTVHHVVPGTTSGALRRNRRLQYPSQTSRDGGEGQDEGEEEGQGCSRGAHVKHRDRSTYEPQRILR